MGRYRCAKCNADRATRGPGGSRCSCGGVYVAEEYTGGLGTFMKESLSAAAERFLEGGACPECGKTGELVGFQWDHGPDYEARRNAYECLCGTRWEVVL